MKPTTYDEALDQMADEIHALKEQVKTLKAENWALQDEVQMLALERLALKEQLARTKPAPLTLPPPVTVGGQTFLPFDVNGVIEWRMGPEARKEGDIPLGEQLKRKLRQG